ncbi:MAG: hypothetical protein OH337_03675 [Candidatus Parvarchaeota archaeon]|nr:hypothetical protein [Candidatus Haiyanarchaeum thermophilum]
MQVQILEWLEELLEKVASDTLALTVTIVILLLSILFFDVVYEYLKWKAQVYRGD